MCMGVIVSVEAGQLSVPLNKSLDIFDLYHHYRVLSDLQETATSYIGQSVLPSPVASFHPGILSAGSLLSCVKLRCTLRCLKLHRIFSKVHWESYAFTGQASV